MWCWGGGRETDTHRWRADDQKVGGRRAREKVDGRGRREGKTTKRHCRLWLLNATTPHELRCLLNDNVNVQQRQNRVWDAQAHDSAERAGGFVSNNHGEEGGDKRVEGQRTLRFGGLRGLFTKRACLVRLVYGADRVCLGSTKAHTPSVQLTLVSTSTGPGPGS